MITTLLELAMTKYWMANPLYFDALRLLVQDNVMGRKQISTEDMAKKSAFRMGVMPTGEMVRMEAPGSEVVHDDDMPEVQSFVAILPVCGPITRNGDACSYGSIDLRDAMMEAANQEECAGIVLYINSGGGSAEAIADYKYAINYVHGKGLKVSAFIDGMCASAAYYLAALCDEICFMNEKDQFGSIGAFAAFYTQKDGEKNEFTNETFRVVYADQCDEKNKWYRDATNGDYKTIKKELNQLNQEFIDDVKVSRPNVTEEHLKGAMFNASDVIGILVDRQSTLDDCCSRLVADHNATAKSSTSNTSSETNTKTSINMQNYPFINAACGLKAGEIAVKEEGAFMNAQLLDNLEANMSASAQKVADAEQKATTAEQSLAKLQGKFDEISAQLTAANEAKVVAEKALADANEAHTKEIETLNAQHTDAVAKKDEEIVSLTEGKAKAESDLKGAQDALATAEQTIADKDAQIASLTNETGNEPEAGEAPANNGEGAKKQTLREFDPSPYKTNAERKAAFERFKHGEE